MNADFLRARRKALELTRDDLAMRAGVDPKTIQRCEQIRTDGKSHRASKDTLERLASVLEVNTYELTRSAAPELVQHLERLSLAPPPPPDSWSGRTVEIQRVIATITGDDPSPCCLAGPSGIGKTALAQLVARRVMRDMPHGVIWLRASHQGRPIDVYEAHARIADGLGFQQRMPPVGTTDGQTRIRAFAREMWAHRRLLILDDVLDAELVAHFMPASGKAPILITTHLMHVAERFGEHTMVLNGLAMDDTRQILSDHIGVHRVQADRHGVEELHHALGGLPRSIHVAARILQRERLVDIGDHASRIRKDPAAEQFPPALRTQETSLVASFAQVQQHVSPAAWALLGALSIIGEGHGEAPFTPEWAVVSGACASLDTARRLLSELIDVYLVEEISPGETSTTRWFRLSAHVPLLARTIPGERRGGVFEHVARHAVSHRRRVAPAAGPEPVATPQACRRAG